MTFYRQVWINGEPQLNNEDTLEGVAMELKRTRNEIDSLGIAYERAQDSLSSIMEKQKEASEKYKILKGKLVELAEDLDDCDGDCDCDCDKEE